MPNVMPLLLACAAASSPACWSSSALPDGDDGDADGLTSENDDGHDSVDDTAVDDSPADAPGDDADGAEACGTRDCPYDPEYGAPRCRLGETRYAACRISYTVRRLHVARTATELYLQDLSAWEWSLDGTELLLELVWYDDLADEDCLGHCFSSGCGVSWYVFRVSDGALLYAEAPYDRSCGSCEEWSGPSTCEPLVECSFDTPECDVACLCRSAFGPGADVVYYWYVSCGSSCPAVELDWTFVGDTLVGLLHRYRPSTGEHLPPIDVPLLRRGEIRFGSP